MSKHFAPRSAQLLDWGRFCRNTTAPTARLYNEIGVRHNHTLAHRRKVFGTHATRYDSPPNSSYNGFSQFPTYARTGVGATGIACMIGLVKNTTATSEGAWYLYDFDAATTTIAPGVRYGYDSAADAALQDLNIFTAKFAVSELSSYALYYASTYQAPMFASVYELAPKTYDTENAIYLRQNESEGSPIWDSARESVISTTFDAWKYNGATLISWAAENNGVLNDIGTTATNVVDLSSTAYLASTPGWYLSLTGKTTLNRTTVPCVFAVQCEVLTATGTVYLYDAVGYTLLTSISITVGGGDGIGWYTVAVDIPVTTTKVDVLAKAGAGGTMEVLAVSLFQWEA